MTIERILLDPNAVAYTDDEIVGKVNAAAVKITRGDSVEIAAVLESATEKLMSDTEKTKLAGIEEGAKDDQSGVEIRDAVVTLPDLERKIVLTNPQTGEFKVTAVQVASDGKVAVDKDSVPEP